MDRGAQNAESTTWGHCTLLPTRFGFVGAEESNVNITESDPYAIYRNFLTDEILELVANETNRYAQQFISTHQLRRRSLMRKWKDTNAKEIEKFFGIIIIMGIVQFPQLRLYWSKDPMYRNELVRSMTRNRFDLLLQCLHFCNNDDIDDNTKKLFKVEKVINLAIAQFIQATNPGKDMAIDETMIPWRGRLSFCQYIPGKAHKYGVKLYKLCSVEGYTWNLKSLLWKRCERQFYKITFRKCCDDTDEGFAYDWKRAVRRQFLHKLIFDRNFVCKSSISMRNFAAAKKRKLKKCATRN